MINDVLIGPGPNNYGEICSHCRCHNYKHYPGCETLKNNCKVNKHDDCVMSDCKCLCHGELSRAELKQLREFLKKKK